MANVTIAIELSGGEDVAGTPSFEPGSRLEGTVRVTAADNINCRGVLVRVGWRTTGRANTEAALVGTVTIAPGPLAAGTSLSQPFALDLPHEPWSYAGQLIQILWEARAVIDLALVQDISAVAPFILAPRGRGPATPSDQPAAPASSTSALGAPTA